MEIAFALVPTQTPSRLCKQCRPKRMALLKSCYLLFLVIFFVKGRNCQTTAVPHYTTKEEFLGQSTDYLYYDWTTSDVFYNGTPPWDLPGFLSPEVPKYLSSIEDLLAYNVSSNIPAESKRLISNFTNLFQQRVLDIQLRYCPYVHLCTIPAIEPSSFSTFYYPCCSACSCDLATCRRDLDCCPDIIQPSKFEVRAEIEPAGSMENNRETERSGDGNDASTSRRTCMPLEFHPGVLTGYVYAVSECPSSTEGHALRCTQTYTGNIAMLADIVPCYKRNTSELFRNRFCAYCHGLSDRDVVFFDPSVHCFDSSYFNNIPNTKSLLEYVSSSHSHCTIQFTRRREMDRFKTCVKTVDKCNSTGLWTVYSKQVESACNLYTSIIEYKGLLYKNIFCVVCNGLTVENFDTLCAYFQDDIIFPPFSALLRIEQTEGESDARDKTCSSNGIYDKKAVMS